MAPRELADGTTIASGWNTSAVGLAALDAARLRADAGQDVAGFHALTVANLASAYPGAISLPV